MRFLALSMTIEVATDGRTAVPAHLASFLCLCTETDSAHPLMREPEVVLPLPETTWTELSIRHSKRRLRLHKPHDP